MKNSFYFLSVLLLILTLLCSITFNKKIKKRTHSKLKSLSKLAKRMTRASNNNSNEKRSSQPEDNEDITSNSMDVIVKNHLKKNPSTKTNIEFSPPVGNISNHFGQPPQKSDFRSAKSIKFDMKEFQGTHNIRKYLEFKPFPGYEKYTNPRHIKSGDFNNIAPSAKYLVTPTYIDPKIKVSAKFNNPKIIGIPTYNGKKKEVKEITAYDKEKMQIITEKIEVERPLIQLEPGITNDPIVIEQVYDVKTGNKVMDGDKQQNKTFHGVR